MTFTEWQALAKRINAIAERIGRMKIDRAKHIALAHGIGADVLAATIATTEAQRELASKEFAKKIERRGEILSDILERYDSDRCGINGMRGTAWAAFNAVTESADWKNGKRHVGSDEARASRKLESVIAGEADDMKQVAYVKALEYVSA